LPNSAAFRGKFSTISSSYGPLNPAKCAIFAVVNCNWQIQCVY